ncbi:MAG: hypothetical protein WCJ72_18130, partial [Chryseobacterium sp.]
MENPDSNQVGKFQQLIIKNPLAFVASVFFIMFWITYFLNVRKSDNSESYYKKLYEYERNKNDNLNNDLLIKAGIIEKRNEEIKIADSTLTIPMKVYTLFRPKWTVV